MVIEEPNTRLADWQNMGLILGVSCEEFGSFDAQSEVAQVDLIHVPPFDVELILSHGTIQWCEMKEVALDHWETLSEFPKACPSLHMQREDIATFLNSLSDTRSPSRMPAGSFPRVFPTEPRASEIIKRLGESTLEIDEKRQLVIEVEVLPVSAADANRLKDILRYFIVEFRNSSDPVTLVAVESAIRKCVAMMEPADLSSLTVFLDADNNVTIPVEIELEVTKTLVRWLTVHPPQNADPEPRLADCLVELTETYVTPRMLSRKKYGAVALNAILGLLMLRSRHTSSVLKKLNGRPETRWFSELVVRRAGQIRDALLQRFGGVIAEEYAEGLAALMAEQASG